MRIVGRLVLDRMVDNFFAETEQVAFMTQNVPPGIDFSNDPLLQGRNFSYLDTQIKRLGGPNFTHIPINAPRCPFAHFQQDGHMAMRNPKGRANYEPNSWGAEGGPRENPATRLPQLCRKTPRATRCALRPESFADHYSQARQFFISQTPIEQKHIGDALVFELSKVERPDIRVAHGLRTCATSMTSWPARSPMVWVSTCPSRAGGARQLATIFQPRPMRSASSRTGRNSFEGRKLGILLTDGADAALFAALTAARRQSRRRVRGDRAEDRRRHALGSQEWYPPSRRSMAAHPSCMTRWRFLHLGGGSRDAR